MTHSESPGRWDCLAPELHRRLLRELDRWKLLSQQIRKLEADRRRRIRGADTPHVDRVRALGRIAPKSKAAHQALEDASKDNRRDVRKAAERILKSRGKRQREKGSGLEGFGTGQKSRAIRSSSTAKSCET